MPSLGERFWGKVTKTEGCWLWKAGRNKPGWYGRFYLSKVGVLAHRLSWEEHFGAVPHGMSVLHSCDTPNCVRPDHLFLGTQVDNVKDMIQKGRRRTGRGRRKLTPKLVAAIRSEERASVSEQVDRYGVSPATIYRVRAGTTYQELNEKESYGG